jgi:hypothetical protein
MTQQSVRKLVFILVAGLVAAMAPMRSALAINDRNNEPICREAGSVDPRCF